MVRFFALADHQSVTLKAVRVDGHKHVGDFDILQRYAPAVHQAACIAAALGKAAQHEQIHTLKALGGLAF